MSAPPDRSPLKVLFVVDGLWVGGTERSLAELLPALVKDGIRPLVACFQRCPEEGVEAEVLAAGHDVRFLPSRSLPAQVRALRRLLEEERPAILHSSLFRANLVARLAGVGRPVRVLNSLVNTPYVAARFRDPRIRPLKLRLVQLVDRLTGRMLADHFHAVSNAAKEMAVASLGLPAARITVVERGRDPGRLGRPGAERRRAARRSLGVAEDDELLVSVGRQDFQKGQEHLLRAVALLAPSRPRLRLLLAGRTGSATQRLVQLREELGLDDRVRMLGHRQDLPEILAAADLFVFPSLFEGLPGAVIEAEALALPVVATDIPAVREVVEPDRNALLVPTASSVELADAVCRLLDDPRRLAEFAARSREIFEERFLLARSSDAMIRLYREMAA